MSDWIPIGEPEPPPLTPTQQRIREMLQAGIPVWKIASTLRMGLVFVREEIYQIRKWESIMGKGKLDNTQRAAIYQAWKDGTSQAELARQYGVSDVSIHNLIKKLKNAEPLKKPQINEEFDAAVDEMIAERNAADAEEKSAIAESERKDLPQYVVNAIRCRLVGIEAEIAEKKQSISALEQEIADLCNEYDDLNAWRDAHDCVED